MRLAAIIALAIGFSSGPLIAGEGKLPLEQWRVANCIGKIDAVFDWALKRDNDLSVHAKDLNSKLTENFLSGEPSSPDGSFLVIAQSQRTQQHLLSGQVYLKGNEMILLFGRPWSSKTDDTNAVHRAAAKAMKHCTRVAKRFGENHD